MRADRVLVVGATGMLGAPVAQRLLTEGWKVRCLVRDAARARAKLGPDFEFVTGDVTQAETLDQAFEGCGHVHLNLRGTNTPASYDTQEVQGAANCADAARRHGLRRITYLSGAGQMTDANNRFLPVRIKRSVEVSIAQSGVPWTFFRATHFMESLPLFVRDGRASVLGRQPHLLHYLAAADYAAMAARALDSEQAQNQALYLFGPQAFTMRDALWLYVSVLHPELKVTTLPLPVARIIATLTRNQDLRFAADLFAAFAAIGEHGDPEEANRLFGTPSTTLGDWLRGRRDSLRSAS